MAIEVCLTVQNLNDKRSRYIPASHSLVLPCSRKWLIEPIKLQKGGLKPRWKASGSITKEPGDVSFPIRHLRVLYALPNDVYKTWGPSHTPAGYEYFCRHSSLNTYWSKKMQTFLGRMSVDSQFYTRF